jgi:PKD repeat protein
VGTYGTILHYTAITTTSTTTSVTSTTSTTTSVTPTTTTTVQSTTTTSIPDRKVDFAGSPTSGYRPLKVKFTSLCEGDISDYYWDFGDGSQTNEIPNPTHTYKAVGTFSVILTVTFSDGTAETVVKESYISVLRRFNCAFASALMNKNDLRILRNLRDSMPDNIYWFAIASIYYSSSSEVTSILQGNPELRDRLRELVSGNIEIAEQLTAEREITVDENVINEIISFMNDLKSEGSPALQDNIDFVIRGIEDGYLLNGLGIYID